MKKDVENKLIDERNLRLDSMPSFIKKFIIYSETTKTLPTQLAYLQDITIFLEFMKLQFKSLQDKEIEDFSPSDLDILTEEDIIEFLNYLNRYNKTFYKKNNSTLITQTFSNTVYGKSRKLATIHALFKYLFKRKLIAKDVTQNVDVKVPIKKSISNRIDGADIRKLISVIDNDKDVKEGREEKLHQKLKLRDSLITLLFAYTGIRINELVQLDIDDVDVDKGLMIVTRKGGNQERIYLPEEVLEPLADYIVQRKKINDVPNEYKKALFISLHKKRINPRTVRSLLQKYKERSGINIKITPHTFRRSFGTEFYNQTGDMYLTAQQLGHSSAETTRKYYAEPSEERKKESMQNFNYNGKHDKICKNNTLLESEIKLDDEKITELLRLTGMTYDELINKLK